MQLSASAPTQSTLKTFRLPLIAALRNFFYKQTFFGFRIGEALLWFGFVIMWPVLLGSIYFFGGIFESGRTMPVPQFIATSLVVAFTKAIVIIPFWWLFFVRLRNQPLWKRIAFHPLTACVYAVLCIFLIYHVKKYFLIGISPSTSFVINKDKTKAIQEAYPMSAVLVDFYNLLSSYVMNFMVFHAYNFWLSSQRQKKKEQELRELAFQSEINALKTQIEPHFLFNTLNSISASVPPSLEKTRVLISQLADTFRYALRVSESQFVRLGDEIEFMKTWLALEKQRFGSRLKVHYRIDAEAMETMVPPMILQPLVENALNHGLAPKVEGGEVSICCAKEEDGVAVSVCDTGVGYSGDLEEIFTKSVGLSNILKRLKLLYDQPLHVARQNEGLCFSFFIPYQQLHEKKSSHN